MHVVENLRIAWLWFKTFCKEWGAIVLVVAAIIAFAYPIIDAFYKAKIELWITIGFVVSLILFIVVSIMMHIRILNKQKKLEADAQVLNAQIKDNLNKTQTLGENEKTKQPLTKTQIVAWAIEDARRITPSGKDVIVYITNVNRLATAMFTEELKSILLKFQDDAGCLILKSFPDWLLDKNKTSRVYQELLFRSLNDRTLMSFTVSIRDGFSQYIRSLS
jgi:hypothetical protein